MFAGCASGANKGSVTDTMEEAVFSAKILEIKESSVLVEPLESEEIRNSADQISFGTAALADIGAEAGDIVRITYTGEIAESYPAQIRASDWTLVEKGGEASVGETGTLEPDSAAALERDFEAVKKHLAAYPNELDAIEKTESYVIVHGEERSGSIYWEAFDKAVKSGIPARIDIIRFTVEGDPIIDYISYDGTDFYVVNDFSRDAFAGVGNDEPYTEMNFPYLKVFEGTNENGDQYRQILLTDTDSLAQKLLEEYIEEGEQPENVEIYYLASVVLGNTHAQITGEEAWHEVETIFDESAVLSDVGKITKMEALNGNTGETKTFTDGEEFQDILALYQALDFEPDEALESRQGYSYALRLYDDSGILLQSLYPYKDAVQIDGTIYDGSMNGSCVKLLLKLDLLF